jgi:hypothetical protein
MAFRFRKRIKLLPGVWLNLGKNGISTSEGGNEAPVGDGSAAKHPGNNWACDEPGDARTASHLAPPPRNRRRIPTARPPKQHV